MDKQTLSNYGWIVVCVLVLVTLLAFATPFGSFIANGFQAATAGFFYTGDGALTDVLDTLGVVASTEELQEKHQFEYYSSLKRAVDDVNAGAIGKNADRDKEDAVAGIYVDRGKTYVVLLKDDTEAERIQPSVDMTINLGGNTLTSTAQIAIDCVAGNLKIDGRLDGSTIYKHDTTNRKTRLLQTRPDTTLAIDSGTYILETDVSEESVNLYTRGLVEVSNCKFVSTNENGPARGLHLSGLSIATTEITNCDITVTGNGGNTTIGVWNGTKCAISECDINVKTVDKIANAVDNDEEGASTLYMSDCNLIATTTGTNSQASTNDLYAAGIYSVAFQNAKPAIITNCNIKSIGNDAIANGIINFSTAQISNSTIEGTSNKNDSFSAVGVLNQTHNTEDAVLRFNYCTVSASSTAVCLSGKSANYEAAVCFSNSRVKTTNKITTGDTTHRIYIGKGNDFDNSIFNNQNAIILTDEVYS